MTGTKRSVTRFGSGAVIVGLVALVACTDLEASPVAVQLNGHVVERTAQGAPTGRVEFGVSAFDGNGDVIPRAGIRTVRATVQASAQQLGAAAVVVNGRACGDIVPGGGALATVLMIDESGSMWQSDPQKLRHLAGQRFVLGFGADDAVSVARFPASPSRTVGLRDARVMAPFGSDERTLLDAVAATPHGYGTRTPLWHATHDAVTLVSQRRETNRVAVVLTDGNNEGASGSAAEANAFARAQGVKVFAVGFGSARARELDALVEGTGGYRDLMDANDPNRTIENLLDHLTAATQAQGCIELTFSPTPAEGTRVRGMVEIEFDDVTLSDAFDVLF